METGGFVSWRIKGVLDGIKDACADISPTEWTSRPHPTANMIGFTCWHVPATIDWAVHTAVRGVGEIKARPQWAGSGISFRQPFGMSLEEADWVAHNTDADSVIEYTQSVRTEVGEWLSSVAPGLFETVPPVADNLAKNPLNEAEFAEVPWILEAPTYQILGRPAMGHGFRHLGEIDLALEVLRS